MQARKSHQHMQSRPGWLRVLNPACPAVSPMERLELGGRQPGSYPDLAAPFLWLSSAQPRNVQQARGNTDSLPRLVPQQLKWCPSDHLNEAIKRTILPRRDRVRWTRRLITHTFGHGTRISALLSCQGPPVLVQVLDQERNRFTECTGSSQCIPCSIRKLR